MAKLRALFLDRDGVLTRDRSDYVKDPGELDLLPFDPGALKKVRAHGFVIVVVTNQSVVGRGLVTMEDLDKIHDKLRSEMENRGCKIDAIYSCPHRPEQNCSCRKPEPGLFLKAAKDLKIDLASSWMIGDKEIDAEAARRAGCQSILLTTNQGGLENAIYQILNSETTTVGSLQ